MKHPVEETLISLTAGGADGGARLDKWLSAQIAELSRARIQSLLASGQVRLGGRTIDDASYRVKPGEEFHVRIPAPADTVLQAENIPLNIVYEDETLIVIDKPAGLVVHPGAGNWQGTLVHALLAHCGDSLSGIGGVKRPGIVHRLDKLTSGLLVAAKTGRAHEILAAQFAEHSVTRSYLALVWGAPSPPRGRLVSQIGRSPSNRQKMAVRPSGGKQAITNYETLQSYGNPQRPVISLMRCRLETGRTHQIRVHLAHLGHPVVGDPVYGGKRQGAGRALTGDIRQLIPELGRQALHATTLGFTHPASGEVLLFESPLPGEISRLLPLLEQIQPLTFNTYKSSKP